jgi:hypothetical protein
VADCVSRAGIGNTINVSAGAASWSSPITITKGVYIVGAGSSSKIITGSGFVIDLNSDAPVEISGFGLKSSGSGNGTGISVRDEAVHEEQIRIYNCSFERYEFGIWVESAHGVVHDCTFTNNDHDLRVKGYLSGELNNHAQSPPWAWNSQHFWVMEDCTFNWSRSDMSIRIDTEYPASFIIRHSTFNITGSAGYADIIDMHGSAGVAENRVGILLYGNTINAAYDVRFADIRGGINHLVYNNRIIGSDTWIDLSANPGGSQKATNTYIWNNTGSWGISAQDGVRLNVEYFMSQPANFSELQYPHPLRSQSGQAPPAAPYNVRIISEQ